LLFGFLQRCRAYGAGKISNREIHLITKRDFENLPLTIMKKWLCYLLLSIATLGLAKDATFLRDYSTNDVLITAGFIPDSSRIIVGEPLFLTFVVSNRADQPFHFSFFGDSNFRIAATNTAGMPTRNRHPGWGGDGGGSSVSVLRGKAYNERVLLDNWCGFDQPGEYTVTCRYLFPNYPNGNTFLAPPIVTVFKLTVLPTDPNRITEIIKAWGHVVETNGSLHEAAQALAEINDPRTIPYLAVLVMKGSDINYIAVEALARFTNNLAAADALTSALKNGDEFFIYVPQVASTALRSFRQTNRAARTLLPGLTNSDANVRIQTARAISWTGSEFAFAPLCSLLQDESNSVRYVAAQAIGRLADARSFAVLTNLLNNSDFYLRFAAVKGLVALNQPFQAAWLTPIIRIGRNNDETNFQPSTDAMSMTSLYGGDQALPGLVNCLDFDNPSLKDWFNFYLLQYIGANWKPSYEHFYKWHHDANRDGTEEELAENRQILSELKAWLEKHKQN
jgi:hypothetical protein